MIDCRIMWRMMHDAWASKRVLGKMKNLFLTICEVSLGCRQLWTFAFPRNFRTLCGHLPRRLKRNNWEKSLKLHTTFLVSSFLSFIFARKSIFIPITTRAMVLETMKKTSKTMDAFILVQKRHWVRIWAQITRWENEKPSSQKWETVLDVDASTNLFYPRGRIVT